MGAVQVRGAVLVCSLVGRQGLHVGLESSTVLTAVALCDRSPLWVSRMWSLLVLLAQRDGCWVCVRVHARA